jgi:aminoglycoside phosphotransferase (APT) family kinase protein
VPPRPDAQLDAAKLDAYLRLAAPEVGQVLEIRQFPGGFSNLTYSLLAEGGTFVLRRPPEGAAIRSAHDMGREFRVLSLLRPHYGKVPRPVVFCENEEVLGAPFYLMERIEGAVLRPANAAQMELPPALLRRIGENLVDNLAALHSLDIQATGLAALGKPEGYVARQVEGWAKRYRAAQTDTLPAMEALTDWLPAHLPPEQAPAFLHNDYKHDNILLNANDLAEIKGVLDWEMSTVGDPLMDLGATLAYWVEAGDAPLARSYNLTWLPGNLSRREVTERYAARTGRDVSHIAFYHAFGLFKNAVIAQQIYARWKQGHSQDARFGRLLPMIEHLAEQAERAVREGF